MKQNQEYYNFMNLQEFYDKQGILYDDIYMRWIKDIVNTKIGMFTYDNLPKGLTSQIVEMCLIFNRNLCWYYDERLERVILCRYIFGGDYDLYWKPVNVNLLTISGKPVKYNVPYEDIILFRDNTLDIPPYLTLNSYIDKIITIEKTIDILIKLIRIPAIFQGSKESISTLKILLKKITDFEGIAISDKALTADSLVQFPVTLPCKLEELYDLLRKYKEQALASIGIYSVDEKRERIVTSEIMAQNDYVDFVYSNMYNERKLSIDLVNEKYGLNIKINEVYTENKKDEMDINAYGINKVEQAKANATIKVEEIKNEGDVKVAEIESKGDNNVPH